MVAVKQGTYGTVERLSLEIEDRAERISGAASNFASSWDREDLDTLIECYNLLSLALADAYKWAPSHWNVRPLKGARLGR